MGLSAGRPACFFFFVFFFTKTSPFASLKTALMGVYIFRSTRGDWIKIGHHKLTPSRPNVYYRIARRGFHSCVHPTELAAFLDAEHFELVRWYPSLGRRDDARAPRVPGVVRGVPPGRRPGARCRVPRPTRRVASRRRRGAPPGLRVGGQERVSKPSSRRSSPFMSGCPALLHVRSFL